MDKAQKFWDRLANRYARAPVSDEAAYQTKLAKTREYFTPDAAVMEFGCGTGSTAIIHASYVKTYLATDISEKMLEIARGKAGGVENLTFEQCGLEGISAPEGGYDAVLGHSILHLLEDRDAAIAQVFELLKPGGVFISSTTCMGKGGLLKLLLPIGRAFGLLPLVRFFTPEALEESIVAAGFGIDHRWQPTPKAALFLVARKPLS